MNILQVLSQFEVTGAETFAATLANEQIASGHNVIIVSDTFHTPTDAEVILHPIGKRDIAQRFKNIRFLNKLVKERTIDVVHAHSRAASWVSYFATRRGNVPLVSSIHGRQHLHFSSKMFSIYGEKRVAVCRSIYNHLNHDLKYPLDTLALVHNGIDLTKWKFQHHSPPKREKKIAAFVGRLSGFKGDSLLVIVEKIFPLVFEKYKNVEFHIIGGMNEQSKILPAIEETNKKVGVNFIIPKGFHKNVEEVYRTADLIIGSGRVAMEALACGSPVISIGESNYVGIISEQTKNEALVTNFGDLDARRPIEVDASVNSIVQALQHPDQISAEWGRKFIEENFEIKKVSAQMNLVFAEAIATKKEIHEIPVLLYHKIIDGPGNERTINVREFEQQLHYLQRKGFTPLNFFDLREIVTLKKHLPKKPIVLTFDGYEENYRCAFPLLKRFGMTAVFYIRTERTANSPTLSVDQIRELCAQHIEIGSASATGRKFNLLSEEEIFSEVHGSISSLKRQSSSEIISFAFPFGYVTERIKDVVKEAGFLFAVTIDEGRRNFWSDPLKIRRIQIFSGASQFSFWKKTSGWYYWYKNVY